MKNAKRLTALLMSIAAVSGTVPAVYASGETDMNVGDGFIIEEDGTAWDWSKSDKLIELNGKYRDITSNYTVNSDGELYFTQLTDTPRYMLDGKKTVNINQTKQKIMSGASKVVGTKDAPLFVLKQNGELWVIPDTAGRNYRAMSAIRDIIPDTDRSVIMLAESGRAYRWTDMKYVDRGESEQLARDVKKLCSSDGDNFVYINEENELVSLNGRGEQTVEAADIVDGDEINGIFFSISDEGILSYSENGNEPVAFSDDKFISVTASEDSDGCIAVDEDGSVWAWKSCIPYEFYYYGNDIVKIFEDGQPVQPEFEAPVSFDIEVNNDFFDDNMTLTFHEIEGAVDYFVVGSDAEESFDGSAGEVSFELPKGEKYIVLAVNNEGQAFAEGVAECEADYEEPDEIEIIRKNHYQQNTVIGDIVDEQIRILAPNGNKIKAGYRVHDGKKIVYDSGYIWSGKQIEVDGIDYSPEKSGVYSFEIYATASKEQASMSFNVGFLDEPYSDSEFIEVKESRGVYEIRHMSSEKVSGKPRNVYIYSDRGEKDSFYAIDSEGKESFIGVGSAMISAKSGINKFRIESDSPAISVLSFGYGEKFISFMSGNHSVAYEKAEPIYSIFASSSEKIETETEIKTISDVISNTKYFVSLAESKNLTFEESISNEIAENVEKAIDLVTSYNSSKKLSDALVTAIDKLAAKTEDMEYTVFYEYEPMKVSEMIPQNITADGIYLACLRADEDCGDSLYLKLSQKKTEDDSLLNFKLSLINNGKVVKITFPIIFTMQMPNEYIHKDDCKLCLTDDGSTISWIDCTYDSKRNMMTFRTEKLGEFAVRSYNGMINTNDYDNIMSWLAQNQKTVAFVDYDGRVISVQSVFIDNPAAAPTDVLTREGYSFAGWDKTFDKITENLVVTAVYDKLAEDIAEPEKTDESDKPAQHLPKVDIAFAHASFADMKNHWANSYVGALEQMGILNELFTDSFNPDIPMTRGMYVILVSRIIGEDSQWMYDNDIILGYGNGNYGLTDEITREQTAVITKRVIDKLGIEITNDNGRKTYDDNSKISDWAKSAVEYNYKIGCMMGDDMNRFNPQKNVTNAEIATMLWRIAGFFD